MSQAITETNFPDLKLVHRGKVRDLYEVEDKLLMVATDRISAYDVVMGEAIGGKGEVLTGVGWGLAPLLSRKQDSKWTDVYEADEILACVVVGPAAMGSPVCCLLLGCHAVPGRPDCRR